jgi:DUF4097 and DUF4098 domain-containing protein YvlB
MKTKLTLTLILLLIFSASAFADKEYSFRESKEFDTAGISRINIDIPKGDVELRKSTSSKIEIDLKYEIVADNKEDAQEVKDDCEFDAETRDGDLDINVNLTKYHRKHDIFSKLISGNWNDGLKVYLLVKIPDGLKVNMKSSSADLEASNLKAEIEIDGSSSDVELRNVEGEFSADLSSGDVDIYSHIGNISVDGNSSDIRIESAKGNLIIETSSGDGNIDDIEGNVDVRASSGDYRLTDVSNDLDIKTSSGDITVNGVGGSVRAECSSGDIRLRELRAHDGDFDISASSGDVFLSVSPEYSGYFSLKSVSGSINSRISELEDRRSRRRRSDRPILEGSVGSGDGEVFVTTVSGDITVDRY